MEPVTFTIPVMVQPRSIITGCHCHLAAALGTREVRDGADLLGHAVYIPANPQCIVLYHFQSSFKYPTRWVFHPVPQETTL